MNRIEIGRSDACFSVCLLVIWFWRIGIRNWGFWNRRRGEGTKFTEGGSGYKIEIGYVGKWLPLLVHRFRVVWVLVVPLISHGFRTVWVIPLSSHGFKPSIFSWLLNNQLAGGKIFENYQWIYGVQFRTSYLLESSGVFMRGRLVQKALIIEELIMLICVLSKAMLGPWASSSKHFDTIYQRQVF